MKRPGEGGGYVEADQIHRDKLWSAAEGHALIVVDDMVSNIRGFTVADGGGSTAVSIVTNVRESEFTETAAVRLRHDGLVKALVGAHLAVSVMQERKLHSLIGDNAHSYCKRRGWQAVMVKPNYHPGLSVGPE